MKDYVKQNIQIVEAKADRRHTRLKRLYTERLAMIAALLNRFADRKLPLLDIGAREGALLDVLKKQGFINRTGLEIWNRGLEIMLKNGHKIVKADIQEYRSPKRYDTIVLSHVLEHCPEPIRVIDNVNRMLRKDGIVYIEVPMQEDIRINQAGHYCNFPTPQSLLDILPWQQQFFGWCVGERVYYLGKKL